MTIEELLGCTADQWEKMTDAELLKYFEPVLHITRPDLAAKERDSTKSAGGNNNVSKSLDSKMDMARHLAKQFGLDLDDL